MSSFPFSGMGFPNGEVDQGRFCALASSDVLMLATEGRFHMHELQAAGKAVMWRAVPRVDSRPAELKWRVDHCADEVMNLVDEAIRRGAVFTDFVPFNELDLQDERGDQADDNDPNLWPDRYERIGTMLLGVIPQLRDRLPAGCRIWMPPFTPDKHAIDYVNSWRDAAQMSDGLLIHGYDTEQKIADQYSAYRAVFPDKMLKFGEWHGKGDIEVEKRVLTWMSNTMHGDPYFGGAYFFIYRWDNAPGWWSDTYDVEHNPPRFDLFLDPPNTGAPGVLPTPIDTEEPMTDWGAKERAVADVEGIDRNTFRRQMLQESGDNEDVIYCRQDSSAGARGIAQIVPQFHPGVDPCNPDEALAYAAKLMAGYLRAYDGNWALALSCYNAGAGATARGLAGALDGWPYSETINYVSSILSIPRQDAISRLTGVINPTHVDGERIFGPDVPDAVTLQRNDWSCAVRSAYVALYELAEKGEIEPVTYGDGGPRDVYDTLVPLYDDSRNGLHDASGTEMAMALRNGFGINAYNMPVVTLEDVQALAGLCPLLLGGRAWNHWVEVRGLEADGTLILENPSPGWMGIGNELLDSFGRLGPFSMVVLPDIAPVTDPTEMEGEVTKAEADALRNENKSLRDKVGYQSGDVKNAIQKEVDTMRPSLDALQAALNSLENTTA